jgi:hypothetical protein
MKLNRSTFGTPIPMRRPNSTTSIAGEGLFIKMSKAMVASIKCFTVSIFKRVTVARLVFTTDHGKLMV